VVVGMMMVVVVVVMRGAHCLCAWNREGNSGYRGQNESKFPHETYLLGWIFLVLKNDQKHSSSSNRYL
jgi:hypothetical protein